MVPSFSRHRKRGPFLIPAELVTSAPDWFPGETRGPEALAAEIDEGIEPGSELQVLDTSLGRVAVLICADAIKADPHGYRPLIERLRPDLLFVVAMTPETERFGRFAEEMRDHWVGTLFVNAYCLCELLPGAAAKKAPDLAAVDLALFEPMGAAPTRLCWRFGEGEALCCYFNPPKAGAGAGPPRDWRAWQPATEALTPTGLAWLGGSRKRLGVILDLGIHWETP